MNRLVIALIIAVISLVSYFFAREYNLLVPAAGRGLLRRGDIVEIVDLADLTGSRQQWEYSHATSAGLNVVALIALILSVLANDQ